MQILKGVCCQYCCKFETNECPIKTASNWSKWGNWCNEYEPDPTQKDAVPLDSVIPSKNFIKV